MSSYTWTLYFRLDKLQQESVSHIISKFVQEKKKERVIPNRVVTTSLWSLHHRYPFVVIAEQ